MIRSDHLIRREQLIKCTKGQVRRLKTALRWKIPPEQRQRIQMVLLRESGMKQPLIAAAKIAKTALATSRASFNCSTVQLGET